MTSYLRHIPLFIVLLAMLNACGTTGPGKDREPSVTGPEPRTGPPGQDAVEQQLQPPERSLAEVQELSGSMNVYQPDLVMEIIRSLEPVPSGRLSAMIEGQQYDPEFTEWLELALEMRRVLLNGDGVAAAARRWENYHFGHPVNRANFQSLAYRYAAFFPVPSSVAVLLPGEGGLAAAARAIRDGILSAYLEQPGGSVIRFYSSGENADSAIAAYERARQDGAMQMVGPLRIDSTRALSRMEGLDVPVLLLNQPAAERPGYPVGVHSLALSQRTEAEAIAAKALEQGKKRALVIVPANVWGRRVENVFTRVFEEGQGQVSDRARFNTTARDHSTMLTHLLKIDESNKRKADLQSRLGIQLGFEPYRRDDFDFIFLAANPAEGRELKPLLRFHDAGDVPVYAMSRIFSGKPNPSLDQDLNDVIFPVTHWELDAAAESRPQPQSVRGGTFGNLFALGQDAWRLLPWLPLLEKDPDLWYRGQVGALRMQDDGQLSRQPAWAQFSAGRLVPYQWQEKH